MLNLFCANENCRWHVEKRGGTFHLHNGQMVCDDCHYMRPVLNPGRNLWDFETTHLNGQRMHISGIGELRRLEKQFGVRNVTANMDERNWAKAR